MAYEKELPRCKGKSRGKEVRTWMTGDDECNAFSVEYSCGGVYHNNYLDVVGNRDHDCFWNCSNCKYNIKEDE